MIRCNEKYFFAPKFFARNLDNNRDDFPDIHEWDDDEDDKRISHECHDSQSATEPEGSGISEIELCRLDIEPEKCCECRRNHDAQGWEEEEILMKRDKGIEEIILCKKSPRETIKTISDIDGIDDSDRKDKCQNWIPYT